MGWDERCGVVRAAGAACRGLCDTAFLRPSAGAGGGKGALG